MTTDSTVHTSEPGNDPSHERDIQPATPPASGALRMAIGLAQGLALYLLYSSWTAKDGLAMQPMLFKPLLLLALFVPLAAISGLVHMRPRKLLLWVLALTALIAALGVYDVWRSDFGQWLTGDALTKWRTGWDSSWGASPLLVGLLTVGLFIAQSMALAASADGRWIASYHSYFALAWKLLLQIAFATLFTLLLWVVLYTGATLFVLVKLDFLHKLISKAWFNMPVSALAFSTALHLTDVKPVIISSVRKLLLAVLSWLLPLAVVIIAGFLAGLLFTSLQPLWETRNASKVLLGTTALLVLLANMVYQDGLPATGAPRRFITLCLRLACVLPLPLVALAVYALGLRVAQYGWTVERITGALTIVVAAIYALGYAAAGLRRDPRLGLVAPTNVASSFAILAVFVAVLSPLADPARIAVADQLARLKNGKTEAGNFDVRFMRFEGQRYGVQALVELGNDKDERFAAVRERAGQALAKAYRWDFAPVEEPKADIAANVRMHPEGRALPPGFADFDWRHVQSGMVPSCLRRKGESCDAYLVRLPGEKREQILLLGEHNPPTLLAENGQADWRVEGFFPMDQSCRALLRQAAEENRLQWQPSRQSELRIGEMALPMTKPGSGIPTCKAPEPAAPKR
ncbi:DUF4153 domain-containing protein [Herbaspirillum chlorophenolicum]|uniref:DUF4153 domain-containing protein n=1 Tax=Herbaspirillum chlorophenolicum TaxID=211589 RepID=UPI0009E1A94B|nr:DUF4153 domain-containing protein [Herbaspirillum chlorophenolicum]